jgi:hypothetical protein
LAGAAAVVTALADPEVAAHWGHESATPPMSVGALAAHLGRSLGQVLVFLAEPPLAGPSPDRHLMDAGQYFGRLADAVVPDSQHNRDIRERADQEAAPGWAAVAAKARSDHAALAAQVPAEPGDRLIGLPERLSGRPMLLDEYLRTRCVEIAVHLGDLARSLGRVEPGSTGAIPPALIDTAVDVLVAAARARHGDLAVLHGLARRELDAADALHVL